MLTRKPDTLTLIVALVGSITVLGSYMVDLLLSRQRHLEEGRQRLQHFSLMLAEHTARSFEALDILLRDTAADLSNNHRDWRNWEANRGWEYISLRHSRALPQLRDLILFDERGEQRFISTYFPSPRFNVHNRSYFQSLEKGADFVSYGPYVGQNSGRYTYGLARRIADPVGGFGGAAFASIEPAYFPDFCWGNRLSDDFEAVLINGSGQIVASCRPTDLSRQASMVGTQVANTLFGGRLKDRLPDHGQHSISGLQLSISPVPGYSDLRVLAAIPERAVLAPWRQRAVEFSVFSFLIVGVLLAGSWLVRRQIRQLSQVTASLDEHRRSLEERVQQATAELASKKEEAERANTAKSRFLAAASHDLRQPLHALSLFAADLQRQVRSGNTADLQRLAEQISTSTSVLGELLDALLDVSRLDVAGIKTDIRPFALQTVFSRLAASYRRAAQSKNITLRFRPNPAWLVSDIALIERLLANLVSNAIRYTPAGGRVLIAARPQGDQLRIEVRDNGIGIAPEHQAAIFAEFYQVGNTAREQNKGLGLGLSIVDRLARALEIPLSLHSSPHIGTTFAIVVPRAEEHSGRARPSAPNGRIVVVGCRTELADAAGLAETWEFQTVQLPDAESFDPAIEKMPVVAIVDGSQAAAMRERLPAGFPIIVIDDSESGGIAGAYKLGLPLRPAKLRALLEQLQKTGSKSIP